MNANSSLKMDAALRVHAPKLSESKKTSKADKKRYLMLKKQAQKVLAHLNSVSEPEQTRSLHDVAVAAHDGIAKLAEAVEVQQARADVALASDIATFEELEAKLRTLVAASGAGRAVRVQRAEGEEDGEGAGVPAGVTRFIGLGPG